MSSSVSSVACLGTDLKDIEKHGHKGMSAMSNFINNIFTLSATSMKPNIAFSDNSLKAILPKPKIAQLELILRLTSKKNYNYICH